jgi:hypothetical protein
VLASGAHGSGDNASSNIVSSETRAAATDGCADVHMGASMPRLLTHGRDSCSSAWRCAASTF